MINFILIPQALPPLVPQDVNKICRLNYSFYCDFNILLYNNILYNDHSNNWTKNYK
jgi:hypothetical protein